jgi:hypothetical protein
MIRATACAITIGFAASVACANTPDDYATVFAIDTSAAKSSAFSVELTPDVYRWIRSDDLSDVELFNASGAPIPFAWTAREASVAMHDRVVALPALQLPPTKSGAGADLTLVIDRGTDGRLRRIDAGESAKTTTSRDWLLDASADAQPIDSLTLSWSAPASGVVARFSIAASDDLEHWRDVAQATVLALDQDGAKLERRDVTLGGAGAKYLRLHRLDDGDALVGLRADAHSREATSELPPRRWIEAAHEPAEGGATKNKNAWNYALHGALPIEAARVALADDNALAAVTLLARGDGAVGAPWLRIGALTAFRLNEGGEVLSNDDIDVAIARRLGAFRIESTAPIAAAPSLALAFRPDRLVFLAEGEAPFVLAAGSVRAHHATYPIAPALSSLRATLGRDWQPPPATIGASRVAGGEAALLPAPPPFAWRRWLLAGVLVAGALVVALFALSLLRGAKRAP